MHIKNLKIIAVLVLLGASLAFSFNVSASPSLSCTMTYRLHGFSFAYKQYHGAGYISCSDGQKVQVALSSKSIGLTIGVSDIEGTGFFSEVRSIGEIYGSFLALEGHAGAAKSVDAQVLTRGEISLALAGKGRGLDLGVTLGALTIKPK